MIEDKRDVFHRFVRPRRWSSPMAALPLEFRNAGRGGSYDRRVKEEETLCACSEGSKALSWHPHWAMEFRSSPNLYNRFLAFFSPHLPRRKHPVKSFQGCDSPKMFGGASLPPGPGLSLLKKQDASPPPYLTTDRRSETSKGCDRPPPLRTPSCFQHLT